jgi:type IV secretion system protein VirD4
MGSAQKMPRWATWTFGSALAVVGLVMASMVASKVFAWMLFRGEPPFPVRPWTIIAYVWSYGMSGQVKTPATFGAIAGIVALVLPVAVLLAPVRRAMFGDARFATRREIEAADLLSGDGIILGQWNGEVLTSRGQHHVMLAAPTGSGKGVGVVIPNLLAWNHSAVVLDVKLENYRLTAGYRTKCGHKTFLFNPADPNRRTHRWNPLAYIRSDAALRVDDVQKIAYILFPDVDGSDPIWTASSRTLFLGMALYLVETPGKTVSLGQVARETFAGDPMRFKTIIADRQAAGNPLSSACVSAIMDYLETSDNTRTSIRKTFTSRLELFLNPNIDAATAGNDFDLAALRSERMTIFLGVTPDNLGRLAPLLSLFFQQVIDLHTRELPEHNPALKYQLLLLIDEFAALGKMRVLVDSIAYIRGYNIRLMPIFQSPSQVRAIYGHDHAENFFENHTCRIVYEPANFKVAKEISDELGTFTAKSRSKSTPAALAGKGGSVNTGEGGRALLMPQEVLTIGQDTEVLFVRGVRPIMGSKLKYFADPRFVDRLKTVSPALAALGKAMPSREQLSAAMVSDLAPEVPIAPEAVIERAALPEDTRALRPVELADLDRLSSLPLSDFSLDFSGVEIPTGELSEDQLEALADTVYAAITK